jgi:5-methylthioribose kinase
MKTEDVRAHLARRLPQVRTSGDPEPLPGGRLNLVWRVPATPAAVIVKHAPPYVASAPDIPLDPQRLLLESRCLEALGPGGILSEVGSAAARPPRLLDIDRDRHVLVMEDVGSHEELGAWLRSANDARSVADELGRFVGRLHAVSRRHPGLAHDFDNMAVQRTRHEVQYRAVRDFAERAGLENAAEIGVRCVELGERFQRPGVCLIMGDLWPPSVLVAGEDVRVIDWELAHFGNPAQDLGHLAAHLWMQAECAETPAVAARIKDCAETFFAAYLRALGSLRSLLVADSVVEGACVHFGAEVLMRTFGPFSAGYVYDDEPPHGPAVRRAVRAAADHILTPRSTALFALLRHP